MTIRFDDVTTELMKAMKGSLLDGYSGRVVVSRDLQGLVRLFAEGDQPKLNSVKLAPILREKLGKALPDSDEICWVPQSIFENLRSAPGALDLGQNVLVDQMAEGREWLMPLAESPIASTGVPSPPRFVFYGFKGGVGRSSALAMTAWHLSQQGKKVLVLDLDLESPGLGPLLLPTLSGYANEGDTVRPGWPQYGLVDWFVEQAVGQADDELLSSMSQTSKLAAPGGDIYVVPAAGGSYGQFFISKLSRALIDVVAPSSGKIETFGDRLIRAMSALEQKIKPDVVLLDSRAGLHSVAASLLSRLDATCLIFAADSAQTWAGLDHLFSHWRGHDDVVQRVRERLKVVNPLAIDMGEDALRIYRENAHACFSQLYDDEASTIKEEAVSEIDLIDKKPFNFGTHDDDAPHAPVSIRYAPEYARFAPGEESSKIDEKRADYVFGELFAYIDTSLKFAATEPS